MDFLPVNTKIIYFELLNDTITSFSRYTGMSNTFSLEFIICFLSINFLCLFDLT